MVSIIYTCIERWSVIINRKSRGVGGGLEKKMFLYRCYFLSLPTGTAAVVPYGGLQSLSKAVRECTYRRFF